MRLARSSLPIAEVEADGWGISLIEFFIVRPRRGHLPATAPLLKPYVMGNAYTRTSLRRTEPTQPSMKGSLFVAEGSLYPRRLGAVRRRPPVDQHPWSESA